MLSGIFWSRTLFPSSVFLYFIQPRLLYPVQYQPLLFLAEAVPSELSAFVIPNKIGKKFFQGNRSSVILYSLSNVARSHIGDGGFILHTFLNSSSSSLLGGTPEIAGVTVQELVSIAGISISGIRCVL